MILGNSRRLNNGAGNRTKVSSTRTSHRRESQHSDTAIRSNSPNSGKITILPYNMYCVCPLLRYSPET